MRPRYLRIPTEGLLCQLCREPITDAVVDGAVRGRAWAYMCPTCHKVAGCGLGTGAGQRFERQADGRFLLTEGGAP